MLCTSYFTYFIRTATVDDIKVKIVKEKILEYFFFVVLCKQNIELFFKYKRKSILNPIRRFVGRLSRRLAVNTNKKKTE